MYGDDHDNRSWIGIKYLLLPLKKYLYHTNQKKNIFGFGIKNYLKVVTFVGRLIVCGVSNFVSASTYPGADEWITRGIPELGINSFMKPDFVITKVFGANNG